jgi:hypothetical protein
LKGQTQNQGQGERREKGDGKKSTKAQLVEGGIWKPNDAASTNHIYF